MVSVDKEIKFLNEPAEILLNRYKNTTSSEWKILGEKFALELFQKAALKVPAYKDFLKNMIVEKYI